MSAGTKAANKTNGKGKGGKPTAKSNPETVESKYQRFRWSFFQKNDNKAQIMSQEPIKNPRGKLPQRRSWDILKAQKDIKMMPTTRIMDLIYRFSQLIKSQNEIIYWNYKILKKFSLFLK